MISIWHHLTLRNKPNTYTAEHTLTMAYRDVFLGSPSQQQQQIVLADLMAKSGFNRITPPNESDAVLRHTEGKRALFGEIFARLALGPGDVEALNVAARREAALLTE